jgi:hypothetical protein
MTDGMMTSLLIKSFLSNAGAGIISSGR